jgi:hypothetical protein
MQKNIIRVFFKAFAQLQSLVLIKFHMIIMQYLRLYYTSIYSDVRLSQFKVFNHNNLSVTNSKSSENVPRFKVFL